MEVILAFWATHQGSFYLAWVAAGVRYTWSKEAPTGKKLAGTILATSVIAVITQALVNEQQDMTEGWRLAAIGVCALVAPDIIDMILAAVQKIKEDPSTFFRELLNRFLPSKKGNQDD